MSHGSEQHEQHGHHDAGSQLEEALRLLAAGDLPHAAHHLASAAIGLPDDPRLHDAVVKLCATAPEPLELVSLEGGGHVGVFVLRAMIEARAGRVTDALCHLLQAECHDPSVAYLSAVSVGGLGTGALADVDADRVGEHLSRLGRSIDDLDQPEKSAALGRARGLFNRLLEHHSRSEPLTFAACVLLRRMKEYDAGLRLAEAFLEKATSRRVLIAIGSTSREKGDRDRAIEVYTAAQAMDPAEIGPSLDLGDMYGEAGRFEDAVESYAFALRGEPENAWAQASLHYYRWLVSDEPSDLAALATLASDADSRRAQRLYRQVTIYGDSLPPRRDAILKALGGGSTLLASASSSLEAPSAVSVARRLAPEMRIDQGDAGGVNPRTPRRAVKTLLWRYRTTGPFEKELTNDVEIAAKEADPVVTAAIRKLAAEQYSAAAWFADAREIAGRLGPKSLGACAAAMVALDGLPGDDSLGDWVFDCQVAAAFVLAHLPGGREALWDLVYGPVDWTSSAAIVALAQVAIEEPGERLAITTELFAQIEAVQNPLGHACLTLPAALNLLRIPGTTPEVRQIARAVRDRELRR